MKRVICLVGLPGSGKSSATRYLEQMLGARGLHLPAVVGHLIAAEERMAARHYARLLTGVESEFLAEVEKAPESIVVLDGFLRSADRVRLFHRTALERSWQVDVLYLSLGWLYGAGLSLARQLRRDFSRDRGLARMLWKLRRDILGVPKVLREVRSLGLPLGLIDATGTERDLEARLLQRLGMDLESLAWDRDALQTLAQVAPDAWVTGGSHAYRPFFEKRFGPPIESWDVDARVFGQTRAEEVQQALNHVAPGKRWHVKDALSWARKELGHDVSSVEETFQANALICICFGVRWSQNRIEVRWGHPEAESDLRRGILRQNPEGQIAFSEAKARKIIDYFPGVSAPFLGHPRRNIELTHDAAMRRVSAEEDGGRHSRGVLTGAEAALADEIRHLRRTLDRAPVAVPWPDPAPLPEGDPWLAEDSRFRSWVVNQVRSRNPIGGRCEYLSNALRQQEGILQKPTHSGWSLHLHAFHTLLQIRTDDLPQFRRALRCAILWHDVGKLWNVNSPGAHALISARKWTSLQESKLAGIEQPEEELVSRLIACHDVFGRLERGLWDETYRGAMSPEEIRCKLRFPEIALPTMVCAAKALWLADVGSIPLLRWLRPLAGPLERMVNSSEGR